MDRRTPHFPHDFLRAKYCLTQYGPVAWDSHSPLEGVSEDIAWGEGNDDYDSLLAQF